MSFNFYAFIFLLFALISCKEPDLCSNCPDPEPPNPADALLVRWQVPLNPDTAECFSMRPLLYQDQVLYSMLFYVDGYEFLRMVKAEDGSPVWNWDPPHQGETANKSSRQAVGDLLLLNHWNYYYGIDLQTGQNKWESYVGADNSSGSPYMSIIGDYFYTMHKSRWVADTIAFMTRATISTGKWDTLFSVKISEGYSPFLHPPTLHISPEGDSILICQNRKWSFPASDGSVDLFAFNLKTRSIIWERKDFIPEGNSSVEQIVVQDQRVYFFSQSSLYCIDPNTGKTLWKWTTPESYDNLLFTNALFAEGLLFVKPTNEYQLFALDPSNGNTLYSINTGAGGVNMNYHNGIIYFSSQGDGKLYAVRLSDKQVLWKFSSPNKSKPGKAAGKAVFDDIRISPEHNCLFVGDRFYLMAIELIQ